MDKTKTFRVDRYALMPPPDIMDEFLGNYYLIKAEIRNQKPIQWRRVVVHSMQSFSALHQTLLQAFGLENNHLAAFHEYARSKTDLICEATQAYSIFNPALFLLDVIEDQEGYKLHYMYNYEQPLELILTVEKVVKQQSDISNRLAMSSRN